MMLSTLKMPEREINERKENINKTNLLFFSLTIIFISHFTKPQFGLSHHLYSLVNVWRDEVLILY